MTTLLWVRNDLRLRDNSALEYARKLKNPILPVFIFYPEADHPWEMGAASRWWLHHSLEKFQARLKEIGLSLFIQKGDPVAHLKKLVSQTKATHLLWNRAYDPFSLVLQRKVVTMAKKMECESLDFSGALLFEPGNVMSGSEKPYTVFTPFWKNCLKRPAPEPVASSREKIRSVSQRGISIAALKLLPKIHWDKEFSSHWEPGEEGAWRRLRRFDPSKYEKGRDYPAVDLTSRLSPHLHFGEITPRQIRHAVSNRAFLREIGWREFAYHVLYFFPKTPSHALRKEFDRFPWKKSKRLLSLWQKGMTGVPIVDAGMRQLWRTGWMHNRVRMIVASYLVKDLWIPWQEGAKWFWDTLVDADLANNTLGWQWTAGCGADAAPFFRVFNPYTQGKRFDPKGEYVRSFVPELANVPTKWVHTPHLAPKEVRAGIDYPLPVVDHDEARSEALKQFRQFVKRQKR